MVGAGALAPYLIRAYQAIRPGLRQVLVWNRTPDKAQQVADGVRGTPAPVATDLQAAVRAADIVCCATSSPQPLVRGEWLRPGTHLDLIGGFTPDDARGRRRRPCAAPGCSSTAAGSRSSMSAT